METRVVFPLSAGYLVPKVGFFFCYCCVVNKVFVCLVNDVATSQVVGIERRGAIVSPAQWVQNKLSWAAWDELGQEANGFSSCLNGDCLLVWKGGGGGGTFLFPMLLSFLWSENAECFLLSRVYQIWRWVMVWHVFRIKISNGFLLLEKAPCNICSPKIILGSCC